MTCPAGCCNGTEILCIAIPCPVTIVLLGIELTLQLPCLRLTSTTTLTGAQAAQLLALLAQLIAAIGGLIPTV